jgi:bleomycin hydrolase
MKKAENHELNITWENGVATKPWETEIRSMLDRHLGKLPTEISFEGKTYTPFSFAKEVVNLPVNDFVKLTSFSEMPFYQPDMFYVKDNWLSKSDYYSLPLDKFMKTIDYAVSNGFTLAIDLDYTVDILKNPVNFVEFNENEPVTQDKRDEMLSNWLTKDVHLVHLTGIATDENGRKYYVIKDSVGENLGVVTKKYLSENFVKGKVLAVILHKDGIPSAIKKQLALK